MSWTFKTSHGISIFSSKSLGIVMLLNADGRIRIEIELIIGPKS
jgi:hypothetical protein